MHFHHIFPMLHSYPRSVTHFHFPSFPYEWLTLYTAQTGKRMYNMLKILWSQLSLTIKR